ncbi:unnamed protein product [Anisakis simplex]|uniref:Uncharacterized protein n=1 Tax=Anisakis simplex TaxID=6269 RepID=A0A3P6PFK5_ANISI|nr:unnamed protein product [Anisakis simplex]
MSKTCVVVIFSFVWLFLFFTHIIFSSLHFTAIDNIDDMFARLASSRQSLSCTRFIYHCNPFFELVSEYAEIGERCDRVAPFHNFGVYLLRGHTFFTIIFLILALFIFMTTMICHCRMRKQRHLLGNGVRFTSSIWAIVRISQTLQSGFNSPESQPSPIHSSILCSFPFERPLYGERQHESYSRKIFRYLCGTSLANCWNNRSKCVLMGYKRLYGK